MIVQLPDILGCEVGQPTILEPSPDHFVRVQRRRVAGQILQHHPLLPCQPLLDQTRPAVDVVPVPDHRQRPGHFTSQFAQECHNVSRRDVQPFGHQLEVQLRLLGCHAERDAADGTDAVVPLPGRQHRCLAAWGQGTPDGGREHEAGLVQEDQGGGPLPGFPDDAREFIVDPSLDLLVVLFLGAPLGLLAGPAQTLLEDLADVFGVILQPKTAFDDGGHAVSCPELVGPAVVLGPLQEELLQLADLLLAEAWGGAFVGRGGQTALPPCQPTPAVDRGFMYAKDARHGGGRLALLHLLHGPPPSPLQFTCCSYWSCHTSLYGCPVSRTSYSHAGLSNYKNRG